MSLITTDSNAVLTVGQDAVWKVTLDPTENVTGQAFEVSVAVNPDYLADVALPDFMMEDKEFDTEGWTEIFSSSTTAAEHTPASGIVALVITEAQTSLLRAAGPGKYCIDVWRTDSGNRYPVQETRWLQVLPRARQP